MKVIRHWSVNLIRGFSATLLATLLLINGQESIQRFAQFLGIFWLIVGLTYLMNARENKKHNLLGRLWLCRSARSVSS